MSHERYGTRWANGMLPSPSADYFDRLMAQLEAEMPITEAGASARYDELACMRQALRTATSARAYETAIRGWSNFTADASGGGRCAATVGAILSGGRELPAQAPPVEPSQDSSSVARGTVPSNLATPCGEQ